jgi:hypothetical protein
MKKIICILSLLSLCFLSFAQDKKIPQRLELVEIEANGTQIEVFNLPIDGDNNYYLSVGTLGIGDETVQVQFDPLFELFIPLGETLEEAAETLQFMQQLFKTEIGTAIEVDGCLAAGIPNDKTEIARVTYRKSMLTHLLEFSLEREGYIRATHIPRSEFNSLISSLNVYRKLHPNEE